MGAIPSYLLVVIGGRSGGRSTVVQKSTRNKLTPLLRIALEAARFERGPVHQGPRAVRLSHSHSHWRPAARRFDSSHLPFSQLTHPRPPTRPRRLHLSHAAPPPSAISARPPRRRELAGPPTILRGARGTAAAAVLCCDSIRGAFGRLQESELVRLSRPPLLSVHTNVPRAPTSPRRSCAFFHERTSDIQAVQLSQRQCVKACGCLPHSSIARKPTHPGHDHLLDSSGYSETRQAPTRLSVPHLVVHCNKHAARRGTLRRQSGKFAPVSAAGELWMGTRCMQPSTVRLHSCFHPSRAPLISPRPNCWWPWRCV